MSLRPDHQDVSRRARDRRGPTVLPRLRSSGKPSRGHWSAAGDFNQLHRAAKSFDPDGVSRRFTRLTNGFSKRADYHLAAVGLYVAHYNFCRVHETLRTTPANGAAGHDHVWTISELLTACLENAPTKPRKVHRRFTIIQGGRR